MARNQGDVSLWAMADLATPMAVRVVATLRIADHIRRGLRTELGVLAEPAGLKVARIHPASKLAIVELRSMRS